MFSIVRRLDRAAAIRSLLSQAGCVPDPDSLGRPPPRTRAGALSRHVNTAEFLTPPPRTQLGVFALLLGQIATTSPLTDENTTPGLSTFSTPSVGVIVKSGHVESTFTV